MDPAGLSALMELTGPVQVDAWPTPIGADNVVNVTLRDAYAAYERTPERADFLGDGPCRSRPGDDRQPGRDQDRQVLGKAAHQVTSPSPSPGPRTTPGVQLGVAQEMARQVRRHRVTSSNAGGNKIDYYLNRAIDYRVTLHPDNAANSARANADLSIVLDNTAPTSGCLEG